MLASFVRAFRRWRERNRQYALQRALYRVGGGSAPPSLQRKAGWAPPTVIHGPDLADASEDE
jgi:hypothetical protein